jgi:8-oxo-dGTP pyrophosphatase MutT (NUDIX family)
MASPRVRPSGRVLLIDPTGAVLLVRAIGADGTGYWFTPGGGIEPGEDPAAATIREIAEETDIDLTALGPVVLRRRARLDFLGEHIEVDETFHAVMLAGRPAVGHRRLEPYEAESFGGLYWLTATDMRAAPDRIYPLCLPDLVEAILAGRLIEPWQELDLHADVTRVEVTRTA